VFGLGEDREREQREVMLSCGGEREKQSAGKSDESESTRENKRTDD